MKKAWLAAEPALVMALVIGASWAVYLWGRPASPWVAAHYDELNTALFLYVPLIPILLGKAPLEDYGLAHVGRGLKVFAATFVVVAPVYVAVMYLASLYGPSWFHPSFELHVPKAAAKVALFQLLQVALPEEFFFRGYAQGRLDQAFTGRVRIAGASLGWGFVLANALFALAHPLLADPRVPGNWTRLETFVPGLLFGWMRARSGSLVASVLMHAASNLMLFSVIRGG